MSTRKISLGLVVCLLIGLFSQQLLSQRSRPRMSTGMRMNRMPRPNFERMRDMSPEEKMSYFQELAAKQRRAIEEQEALVMREALGVNEQQWKRIEPRLKKVKAYRKEAFISIGFPFQSSFMSSKVPGGQGFGGGFVAG